MDWDDIIPWLFGAAIVIVLGLFIAGTYYEQKDWDKFSADHHCIVTGRREAVGATTILSNGKVGFTTIPAQTTYHCDDGIDYTR